MTFTAWGIKGSECASLLIEGEGPPSPPYWFPEEGTPVLFWTIEADTYREAMVKYHELNGWEPYRGED